MRYPYPFVFAAAVLVAAAPPPAGPPAASSPAPAVTLPPLMRVSATPSPPPNARQGLDGVWEVEIQPPLKNVVYRHFKLVQTGTQLSGEYLDKGGKKYPLSGTLDGTNVRIVVQRPDGSTILLAGTVDGTTDMLGMLTDAKENVPFTASYRPKEKWTENVNAAPGGLGGVGGGP